MVDLLRTGITGGLVNFVLAGTSLAHGGRVKGEGEGEVDTLDGAMFAVEEWRALMALLVMNRHLDEAGGRHHVGY